MRYFNGLCLCLPNIYFITFILVVKSKTLGKANLITIHAQAENPNVEKTRNEVSILNMGANPKELLQEKPKHSQVGMNRTRVLEVEGEGRHHY